MKILCQGMTFTKKVWRGGHVDVILIDVLAAFVHYDVAMHSVLLQYTASIHCPSSVSQRHPPLFCVCILELIFSPLLGLISPQTCAVNSSPSHSTPGSVADSLSFSPTMYSLRKYQSAKRSTSQLNLIAPHGTCSAIYFNCKVGPYFPYMWKILRSVIPEREREEELC